MTITIEFKGDEFKSAGEAIQHANASGRGVAILLAGRYFVVEQAEADRLAADRIAFAYVTDHHGRIVTVPVN